MTDAEHQRLGAAAGLDAGATDLSRKQAVRLIAKHIRERVPLAVVRFGEGEGRLLVADREEPMSVRVASRKLRRQTGIHFDEDETFKVKEMVLEAFDKADVVGIRGSESFNDEHKMWVERVEQVYEERLAAGRKPAYVTHCLVSSDVRDALGDLLNGQRRVSVVSCRNIVGTITASYGVPDVAMYQIPSQYIMRRVDDEYEAALHGVPIWPDFYPRLRRRIQVREPGEVFLVGAGLFGKELCIRIRELGGIALDVGSTLDGLANKVTRGKNRPAPYTPEADG
jgi:hypothetical protein